MSNWPAAVSTATVFNYLKSQDGLLQVLVLQVHRETQTREQDLQPRQIRNLTSAICDFPGMCSSTALDTFTAC
jgi:hypothetical protein